MKWDRSTWRKRERNFQEPRNSARSPDLAFRAHIRQERHRVIVLTSSLLGLGTCRDGARFIPRFANKHVGFATSGRSRDKPVLLSKDEK